MTQETFEALTAEENVCTAQEIINWVKKNQCSVRSKFIPLSRINSIQDKAEKEYERLRKIHWIKKLKNEFDRETELLIIIATCKEAKGEK